MKTQTQGIYEIRNLLDGKRYVGSSSNIRLRWIAHKKSLAQNAHVNRFLQRAWNKHSAEAFTFGLVERVRHRSELVCREQWHLDALRATGWYYNISPTAGSPLGIKHTPETRAKMSVAMKGKIRSPEHKKNLSIALTGKKLSVERCLKMSLARKGIKPTQEARLKMSAASKGNKYCLGHKHTTETRSKMSFAQAGLKKGPMSAIGRENIRAARMNFLEHAAMNGALTTPETRAKMSVAHKARWTRHETRAKMSAALKSRFARPEERAKMARFGLMDNPETRAKISATLKARWARIAAAKSTTGVDQ